MKPAKKQIPIHLAFVVPSNPVPTARPRVVVQAGHAHAYIDTRSRAYQRTVAFYARQAMALRAGGFPIEGLVRLTVRFYRDSWRRCDLDNLVKGVKDALTFAGVWLDDSQVIECHTMKQVSVKEPRAEIEVETWEGT